MVELLTIARLVVRKLHVQTASRALTTLSREPPPPKLNLMEESVPVAMILCDEIMYLVPLTAKDDKLLGRPIGMAKAASTVAKHTLQRALAVEANMDKLVAT